MSESNPAYVIRSASWQRDQDALRQVRSEVFVREQGVPAQLEWDDQDAVSLHLIAEARDGRAIGTARLLPDGRIGRMAVLPAERGSGVGAALLEALLSLARERGLREVHLHAQLSAVGFYQRFGFQVEGEVFEEAGIAHRAMRLAVQ